MNLTQRKNKLRQKATIRVANNAWGTLRATFFIGLVIGCGIGYSLSYFMR